MRTEVATLYLLHFREPYWRKCQHYCGFTSRPLEARMADHRSKGRGSRLVRYALAHDNDFVVARTWEFADWRQARTRELQLKRMHKLSAYCLVCRGNMKKKAEPATKCPQHIRHWFTVGVGKVADRCTRCGAPNPKLSQK